MAKKIPFDLKLLPDFIVAVGEVMGNSECTCFQAWQAPINTVCHFIITTGGIPEGWSDHL